MRRRYKKIFLVCSSISVFSLGSCLSLNSFLDNEFKKINSINQNSKIANNIQKAINSFNDYNIAATNNSISSIVTNNGIVGISNDNKTLVFTTYEGLMIWENTIPNNDVIKNYYANNFSDIDPSNFIINNLVYIEEEGLVGVLFGDSTNTNQILFGLDINTGKLFNPNINNENNVINYVVSVFDGITQLYINSTNNIIGTSGLDYSNYKNKTQLFTLNRNQGVSQLPLSLSLPIGNNENDYFASYIKGLNNTNFALIISESTNINRQKNVYLVAVDDNLNILYDNNNNRITLNIGNFENITSTSDDSINWNDVIRYQTKTILSNSDEITFFSVISGSKSKVLKIKFNLKTKNFKIVWFYNFNNFSDAINGFTFNPITNCLFISNKKTKEQIGSGYINLNYEENPDLVVLETLDSNEIYESGIIKEVSNIIPILTTQASINSTPYISFKYNQNPIGKIYNNSSTSTSISLNFTSLGSPEQEFINSDFYINTLPSSITNQQLEELITINNSLNRFELLIIDRLNNDNEGSMSFKYHISYSNWFNTSTNTSFDLQINISGMYSLNNNFQFNFVTGFNGDTTNDTKYQQVLDLITNGYADSITKDQVIQYFINYNIKTIDNQQLELTTNNITLKPTNGGYSLKIVVSFENPNLPIGINNTTKSYEYNGFKTVAGYEANVIEESNEISILKKNLFPTELTKEDIFENFLELGTNWNEDLSSWNFTLLQNNYDGTVTVNLVYNATTPTLPEHVSSTILDSEVISGFKNIPELFNNQISIAEYTGPATAQNLVNEFRSVPQNSILLKSIKFPYIYENTNLDITIINENTMEIDKRIDMLIGIKPNTQTSLMLANTTSSPYFIFNDEAKQGFEKYFGNNYPFKVSWTLNSIGENYFNWTLPNGVIVEPNQDTFDLDLRYYSYPGINRKMYANEVNEKDIDNIFDVSYYSVEKKLVPNVNDGTLIVIMKLIPPTTQLSTTNSKASMTKVLNIYNFKTPLPSDLQTILFSVAVLLSVVLITIIVVSTIYFIRRNKYKKEIK